MLERLVDGFAAWLDDQRDAGAPHGASSISSLSPRTTIVGLPATHRSWFPFRQVPTSIGAPEAADIIDYVASLTDAQATSLDALLAGRTERLWDAGEGL